MSQLPPPNLESHCTSKLLTSNREAQGMHILRYNRALQARQCSSPSFPTTPRSAVASSPPHVPSAERIRELIHVLSQEVEKMHSRTISIAHENADLREHVGSLMSNPGEPTGLLRSPPTTKLESSEPQPYILACVDDVQEVPLVCSNESRHSRDICKKFEMEGNSTYVRTGSINNLAAARAVENNRTVSPRTPPEVPGKDEDIIVDRLITFSDTVKCQDPISCTDGEGQHQIHSDFSAEVILEAKPGHSLVQNCRGRCSGQSIATTTTNVVVLDENVFPIRRSIQEKMVNVEISLTRRKARMRETPCFDLFMGCFILVNMAVLTLEGQAEGERVANKHGIDTVDNWKDMSDFFRFCDNFFCIAFAIEILVRTCMHGLVHLMEPLGFFELLLVIVNVVELYVFPDGGTGANFTVLRITRMFRLMRVMRMVRVLSLFSSLRVLTKTIYSSISSLAWTMVLLTLIICSIGLMACQLIRENIEDPEFDFELRSWLYVHYGTSTRSIYSIFEATLSGCWPNYARPLIDDVSGYWSLFWLPYAYFVIFAIISIIRAIFLNKTMQNASADAASMIQDHLMKRNAYLEKLKDAFDAIDVGGSGAINREDFELIMQVPKVQALMAVLDFEVKDGSAVFQMLEEEHDGVLTWEEFLKGIMCLKGSARQLDVVSIQRDCKHLMESVITLTEAFEKVHGVSVAIHERLKPMSADYRDIASSLPLTHDTLRTSQKPSLRRSSRASHLSNL